MRVKLSQRMAGPTGNYKAGTVLDLPDDQAGHLIRTGQAQAVDPAPKEAVEVVRSKQSTGPYPGHVERADVEIVETVTTPPIAAGVKRQPG